MYSISDRIIEQLLVCVCARRSLSISIAGYYVTLIVVCSLFLWTSHVHSTETTNILEMKTNCGHNVAPKSCWIERLFFLKNWPRRNEDNRTILSLQFQREMDWNWKFSSFELMVNRKQTKNPVTSNFKFNNWIGKIINLKYKNKTYLAVLSVLSLFELVLLHYWPKFRNGKK